MGTRGNGEAPRLHTADAVVRALRETFPDKQYAFLEQVADAAGFDATGFADCVIMSLWPSRGLDLYGVEVKVSRSDWIAELRNPAKAEKFIRYCDGWYLAVGCADIVQDGELPKWWGLLVPDGKRMKTIVKPPTLTPEPLSRGILAAILRRASEISRNRLYQEHQRGVSEERARKPDAISEKRLEELCAKIREFEEASGLSIQYGYHEGKKIGEAVRLVLTNGGTERIKADLIALKDRAENITKEIAERVLGLNK